MPRNLQVPEAGHQVQWFVMASQPTPPTRNKAWLKKGKGNKTISNLYFRCLKQHVEPFKLLDLLVWCFEKSEDMNPLLGQTMGCESTFLHRLANFQAKNTELWNFCFSNLCFFTPWTKSIKITGPSWCFSISIRPPWLFVPHVFSLTPPKKYHHPPQGGIPTSYKSCCKDPTNGLINRYSWGYINLYL